MNVERSGKENWALIGGGNWIFKLIQGVGQLKVATTQQDSQLRGYRQASWIFVDGGSKNESGMMDLLWVIGSFFMIGCLKQNQQGMFQ